MTTSEGMKKLALIATVSLIASACGGAATPGPKSADSAKSKTAHTKKKAHKSADAEPTKTASNVKVGDYFVQRFSGSFSKEPMTLTERVIAQKGKLIVIDYTLDAGKKSEHLRVKRDAETGRIARVIRFEGKKKIPSDLAAYEAMMDRTVFAADENVASLGDKAETCMVGERELDCHKTRYKVLVGDKPATLSVVTSKAVPGRDVAGELSTADGKLLYRAEIIDMGHNKPGHAVAEK